MVLQHGGIPWYYIRVSGTDLDKVLANGHYIISWRHSRGQDSDSLESFAHKLYPSTGAAEVYLSFCYRGIHKSMPFMAREDSKRQPGEVRCQKDATIVTKRT